MMYATADSRSRHDRGDIGRRHLRMVAGDRAVSADLGPRADERDAHAHVVDLYEREYAGVARLAYLLVADRHLAEDLAHDAFAALFEKWDDLDDESKAPAYLRATATNRAMSAHRRRATADKHAPAAHGQPTTSASAESEALGASSRPDIVAALQQLSPKQRTAVVLKYWLRYTESEIAETIGCSIGSARTHLHRGHGALAAMLGDHHERP
jgi:RNA polymerase sigma factor (sigma-70 family)